MCSALGSSVSSPDWKTFMPGSTSWPFECAAAAWPSAGPNLTPTPKQPGVVMSEDSPTFFSRSAVPAAQDAVSSQHQQQGQGQEQGQGQGQ
jgi:hypothetical protein